MDEIVLMLAWNFDEIKPTKLTSYQKKGFTFTVYDFMGWIVESDGYSMWPLHKNPVAW